MTKKETMPSHDHSPEPAVEHTHPMDTVRELYTPGPPPAPLPAPIAQPVEAEFHDRHQTPEPAIEQPPVPPSPDGQTTEHITWQTTDAAAEHLPPPSQPPAPEAPAVDLAAEHQQIETAYEAAIHDAHAEMFRHKDIVAKAHKTRIAPANAHTLEDWAIKARQYFAHYNLDVKAASKDESQ